MRKKVFYLSVFFTMVTVLAGVAFFIYRMETYKPSVGYGQFVEMVEAGEVTGVEMRGGSIVFSTSAGRRYQTVAPSPDRAVALLERNNIVITAKENRYSPLWSLLTITVPIILTLFIYFYLTHHRHPGQAKEENELARKRVMHIDPARRITFADVAGIPEVLVEVKELVDFLKHVDRFSKLGATIPKGVLLQGPPGTGKTLLARAIAGEATVPFYFFSGSDFVEMFVGVGASRVRDLFADAKKNTPCIVFIDEIDAVGAHRSSGAGLGGQEERGQTLNALLVEMDGFSRDDAIIVLAATNRPDILDPALLRPGRFDRVITILPPDVKGRRRILQIHASKIVTEESLDLDEVARATPGFTGAELANLVNEAALIAARKNQDAVGASAFREARDRLVIGVERKGFVLSEDDKRTIAYHDVGHAILARFLPHADPAQKITIIPRGKAMGYILQQSLSDRQAYTKDYLTDRLTILLGGRAAEEIVLKQQSTGSEDDLLRATELATRMVCQWGMNSALGPIAYTRNSEGFIGGANISLFHSPHTGQHIDAEVRKLVDGCYQAAVDLLVKHRHYLEQFAEILLQTETLDEEEMEIIFECSQRELEAVHEECASCPAKGQCSYSLTPDKRLFPPYTESEPGGPVGNDHCHTLSVACFPN